MKLDFRQMQDMQEELQDKYKEIWSPLCPERARDQLLWMMIEAGEMADIIKKDGDERILRDEAVRGRFIEEICDTLMYFNDVMLCYGITPEELGEKYVQKHAVNMKRW